MALAYLCSRVRRYDPDIKITDNPCSGFRAFVVDHVLRDGSTVEADAVCKELKEMGLASEVIRINWKKELGDDVDVKDITNLESAARRVRYRRLGKMLAYRKMATLLLAHHQDDQYETVLMRLLSGHRNRGLCGMRKAADIPECEGIFKAYNSGWVDDQSERFPFYNTKLTKNETKHLLQDLRNSINQNQLMLEEKPDENWLADLDRFDHGEHDEWAGGKSRKFEVPADLVSMPVEDGGVSIYRPLLEFSKDRLIATCLENNVPWWEDHTNNDPTLTMRNAVRHMHKSCQLPRALQKPAILALSEKCRRRARAEDAEAYRLLERTVLHDLEPHVGSLVVQFPDMSYLKSERRSTSIKHLRRRITQKRIIAGLALQKIIAIVSPELQVPSLPYLQNVISRLFPSLAFSSDSLVISPPKAFAIAGLHFMPIESTPQSVTSTVPTHPRTWYVSRQPYVSNLPLPTWRVSYWSTARVEKRRRHRNGQWKWSTWLPWKYWDGRFWIRMTHRLPYRIVVMPFLTEHAKSFRESLPPEDRDRMAAVLKKFAPGKVRYTLPAIYSEEYVDLDNVVSRPGYPVPDDHTWPENIVRKPGRPPIMPIEPSKMRLLALPTLDIQLPGLSKWLLFETRYKRAERETLQATGSFTRGSFTAPRISKRKCAFPAVIGGPRKVTFRRPFASKR
jgi:tRNA(Ile)-lysidine synthase